MKIDISLKTSSDAIPMYNQIIRFTTQKEPLHRIFICVLKYVGYYSS